MEGLLWGVGVGGVEHTFTKDLRLPRGAEQKSSSEAHYLVRPHILPLVACEHCCRGH